MRYFGDIPASHLERAKELQSLEDWFNKQTNIPPDKAAKGLTCIAHDYYYIEFDEEGDRLLKMVEKVFPGYFTDMVYHQAIKDGEFAQLLEQLCESMGLETMKSLGFIDE